jgi:hypothetical protein
MVEGVWVVERPRPDSDVVVSALNGDCCVVNEVSSDEQPIRIVGLDATDYLTTAEALVLALALVAAVNEVSSE